jgi:hypothetical protein
VLGCDARGREIGDASEIPDVFGVMVATPSADGALRLAVTRPAPRRAMPHPAGLPFGVWLALARAAPCAPDDAAAQNPL